MARIGNAGYRRPYVSTCCAWCGRWFTVDITCRQNRHCSKACAHYTRSTVRVTHLPSCTWCGKRVRQGTTNCGRGTQCTRSTQAATKYVTRVRYGNCLQCAVLYVCRAIGRNVGYCSERCAKRVREYNREYRKRTNGAGDRDITIRKVGDRDGWVCHICTLPVTMVQGQDNDSPSVDHVHALANGGTHTWDNVKLAHRLCNAIKSDGGEGTAAAREPQATPLPPKLSPVSGGHNAAEKESD